MTQAEMILELLSDKEWHSNIEIHEQCKVWRVSARIFDLKERGCDIETKNGEGATYFYRLRRTILEDLAAIKRANELHLPTPVQYTLF